MAFNARALSARLRRLRDDDEGAVTVDWVVLTAGIVGLAMVVIYPILSESVRWGEGLAGLIEDNTLNK